MIATVVRLSSGGKALVDPINQRLKLLSCGQDLRKTIAQAKAISLEHGFGKIWGFVRESEWQGLREHGFCREGLLEGYFDSGAGIAVAHYLTSDRAHTDVSAQEDSIVTTALAGGPLEAISLPPDYTLRLARLADCERISLLLSQVFVTYPTPIDTGAAIRAAMGRHMLFALVEYEGRLVSVASADVDRAHRIAELTDCATVPEHRGRGLITALLAFLEIELVAVQLRSLFTLARATSPSMNRAFASLDYRYRGRLVNNCHIAGKWEDMNLWVKRLTPPVSLWEMLTQAARSMSQETAVSPHTTRPAPSSQDRQ